MNDNLNNALADLINLIIKLIKTGIIAAIIISIVMIITLSINAAIKEFNKPVSVIQSTNTIDCSNIDKNKLTYDQFMHCDF